MPNKTYDFRNIIFRSVSKYLYKFEKYLRDIIEKYFLTYFRLTVLVLVVESHWTDATGSRRKKSFPEIENNSTCWKRESYVVIQDCHPCTGV